jgi:predicted Zn-dependent protease
MRCAFFSVERIAVLLASVAALGCAINPVTGRPEIVTTSTSEEITTGQRMAYAVQREMGLVDDPELAAYLAKLGEQLAKESPRQDVPYHFFVVDMMEPNAFALPGGYIYVSRGLLALSNSEAELAGVVGHEIGHVAARHSTQRETQQTGFGALSTMGSILGGALGGSAGAQSLSGMANSAGAGYIASYGRDQEREADAIGQKMAAEAGYDPAAMSGFLERMGEFVEFMSGGPQQPNFLDSHPPTEERVQATKWRAGTLETEEGDALSTSRAAYLAKLIGLPVGLDPSRGVFFSNHFVQPVEGYTVTFPPGWQMGIAGTLVAAVSPDGVAGIQVERQRGSRDPAKAATSFARAHHLKLEGDRSARIDGMQAYRAYANTRGDAGPLTLDFTWIAHPSGVYRIMSAIPQDRYGEARPIFDAVATHFHRSTAEERASVTKRQLWIARAEPGESLSQLSRRTGNVWSIEETALINGLDAESALPEGQMVKIAVDLPYRP